MKVKQRDVVPIDFPFSDLTGTKVRPALVISNNAYNAANLDAVVLAITSNLSTHDYKVAIEDQDLESGNLPTRSVIRVDKPFSALQAKTLKIQAIVTAKKLEEVKLIVQKLMQ